MTFSPDLLAGLIAFLLTVMVLSYLIGDNPFFRLAIHVFVGAAAGYAGAVAWHQILWPKLFRPIIYGALVEKLLAVIPLLMGILLLAKLSPRAARLGNPVVAYLVGVGAAVAVGGAVMGTLFPQTAATVNLFAPSAGATIEKMFEAGVVLLGAVATVAYFHFGAKAVPGGPRRGKLIQALAWIGQVFVAVTFGALFAGVFAAAMTALVERLLFLWNFLFSLF